MRTLLIVFAAIVSSSTSAASQAPLPPASLARLPASTASAEAGHTVELVAAFVHDAKVRAVEEAVDGLGYRVGAFVAHARETAAPAAVPSGTRPPIAGSQHPVENGGGISQSQLDALANCESSGINGWRTGLFGIESGNEGSKSYDEQVADVNQIYRDHGAGAWGVLCRPILGG